MVNNEKPLIVRALSGEKVERIPLWFMRQAGRYLPEYRELRKKYSMLDCIRTPELAAEISLQPLRRFDLDAAIIFADILNPLIGMGIELDFIAGEGPKIFNPIKNKEDVLTLKVPEDASHVAYTCQAISKVATSLKERNVPVLGFAGAPFTLSAYLIDQDGSPTFHGLKRFAYNNPESWQMLQDKICQMTVQYLVAQVKAGASGVQLFDSWLGVLSAEDFKILVAPYITKIHQGFTALCPETPFIYFSTGSYALFEEFRSLPIKVYGVDWRQSLSAAAQVIGKTKTFQGNIDPILLQSPTDFLLERTKQILQSSATISGGYVFNVGHGLTPETPIDAIEKVVNFVHNEGVSIRQI